MLMTVFLGQIAVVFLMNVLRCDVTAPTSSSMNSGRRADIHPMYKKHDPGLNRRHHLSEKQEPIEKEPIPATPTEGEYRIGRFPQPTPFSLTSGRWILPSIEKRSSGLLVALGARRAIKWHKGGSRGCRRNPLSKPATPDRTPLSDSFGRPTDGYLCPLPRAQSLGLSRFDSTTRSVQLSRRKILHPNVQAPSIT